jgi:hypothetical protein
MSRELEIIGALEVLAGEGYDVTGLVAEYDAGSSGDDVARLMAAAGYGFPEIVGALSRSPRGQQYGRPGLSRPWSPNQPGGRGVSAPGQLMQAASLARALGGNIFQTRGPTRAREYPLGFVSNGTIAPAAQQQITNRPQVPFRVDRLVVPSDIAGSFTIDDLKVGKDSQFAASGSNPARVFAENAVGVSLKGDTAAISQDVVILATNIGGGALTFRASVIGPAVE